MANAAFNRFYDWLVGSNLGYSTNLKTCAVWVLSPSYSFNAADTGTGMTGVRLSNIGSITLMRGDGSAYPSRRIYNRDSGTGLPAPVQLSTGGPTSKLLVTESVSPYEPFFYLDTVTGFPITASGGGYVLVPEMIVEL